MQYTTLYRLLVALFLNQLASVYAKSFGAMKLEVVQVLFRHGERTPLKVEYDVLKYTNLSIYEPYGIECPSSVTDKDNTLEPYGLGCLTNTGKMQAYRIGKILRQRYNDFLNGTYSSQNVYSSWNKRGRTKVTLQLVLAGLAGKVQELATLDWTSIDDQFEPKEFDSHLFMYLTKKFDEHYFNASQTSYGREKFAQIEEIFVRLQELGIEVLREDSSSIAYLHQLLNINEKLKLPLPEWYSNKMKLGIKQGFEALLDVRSYTPLMKRVNGGETVSALIKNLNLKESIENPKKLYLYSMSDWNIGAFARVLNLDQEFRYPKFCTAFILEKWRDSNKQVYLRLLHWNAIEEKLTTVRMESCQEYCPIDDFLERTDGLIPTEEDYFYMYELDVNRIKKPFNLERVGHSFKRQ